MFQNTLDAGNGELAPASPATRSRVRDFTRVASHPQAPRSSSLRYSFFPFEVSVIRKSSAKEFSAVFFVVIVVWGLFVCLFVP